MIKELNKLFTFFYLQAKGVKLPLNLLVRDNSPLAGFLTAWYALGAHSAKTNLVKRRRASSAEEVVSTLKAVESGADVEDDTTTRENVERLQKVDTSWMAYVVGRRTTLATDYIADHIIDKIQSALIGLIMELKSTPFGLSPCKTVWKLRKLKMSNVLLT